jgi:PLP dependent protein
MTPIPSNLKSIRGKILAAAQAAQRDLAGIKLVAVSKTHTVEDITVAIKAGQNVFGENRVQDAKTKFTPSLRALHPPLELHLIGPLQSNKAEEAVRLFDVIQTVDRLSLVEALAKAIQKTGRNPALYAEVNIGNEPQKAGIAIDELGNFLAFCRKSCSLSITGLMCIPPKDAPPIPYFTQMRELALQHKLKHLSMGMSADFEAAIMAGATEVRVGSGIFGERVRRV